MPWETISDRLVRHIWAPDEAPDGEGEITVSPGWYAENGTPVDPETGDDMSYVRTEINKPEVARYLSAERMTHDDFGQQFTNAYGEVVYDAATAEGPWATMTHDSFVKYAKGQLGLGHGQMYVRQQDGKLVKVAG